MVVRAYVVRRAPEVRKVPVLWRRVLRVRLGADYHRPACGIDGVAKGVKFRVAQCVFPAQIIFNIIQRPGGEGRGVEDLVVKRAHAPAAHDRARRAVQARLQPLAVDVVHQGRPALWKFAGVRLHPARSVAARHPAIVTDHVDEASGSEARGDEKVGRRFQRRGANLVAKKVPLARQGVCGGKGGFFWMRGDPQGLQRIAQS